MSTILRTFSDMTQGGQVCVAIVICAAFLFATIAYGLKLDAKVRTRETNTNTKAKGDTDA